MKHSEKNQEAVSATEAKNRKIFYKVVLLTIFDSILKFTDSWFNAKLIELDQKEFWKEGNR